MSDEGTIIERHGAKVALTPNGTGAILECYKKYAGNPIALTMAILDTMSLFSLEVLEMPQNNRWLRKLRRYERLGHIDLSEFDLEDTDDLEYLFVRNVFISPSDVKTIGGYVGMDNDDIKAALELLN